jgi:membrane-bound lytic murein transglycosylase D
MKYASLLIFLFILGCSVDADESNQNLELAAVEESEISNKSITQILSIVPDIPDTLEFAGEILIFDDLDIRERLDKELVVNMHFHSNTIFYLKRANRWFPIMRKILQEEGVHEDLLYLAVIESGLVQATSPSGAKGFWQFMEGTAKDYGLIVNTYVDERMHIEKSTKAACAYLKKAYNKFGSWPLAAAAYNRGAGGIQSDMDYQYMNDFFDLHLNQETSRYVFRILAIKLIFKNPKLYGFDIPQEKMYPPYNVKSIKVSDSIKDLPQWAIEHGINYKILKLLNPWLLRSELVVGQNQEFELLLPETDEQLRVLGGLSSKKDS